ncbi:SCO family protein [Azohydromonas aeria]|uniref:SCO family protein n=1 Tax=Azohydromonas aeria TaxID=2590212 RepID=UPI001E49C3B9|nr:SCO family protein [Azohydromonas aeria]
MTPDAIPAGLRAAPRRRLLLAALAGLAGAAAPRAQTAATAHDSLGPVRPPVAVPDWPLVDETGRPFPLRAHLSGRVTALQLVFTGCSAACPIQGALFAAVAPRLREIQGPQAQLLSLSIDALGDTPAALKAWMARFGAHPAWHAGLPRAQDVDAVLDFLRGRARGADRHTAQVYLFDRRARLAWRTVEMPPAAQVVSLLQSLAGD